MSGLRAAGLGGESQNVDSDASNVCCPYLIRRYDDACLEFLHDGPNFSDTFNYFSCKLSGLEI